MPTNGNSFEKDDKTGYLTPNYQGSAVVFGAESKTRFIKLFEELGDLSKACETVGVSYQTMRDHFKLDEAFARDLQISLHKMEARLTGVMYQKALQENGTMDRFGWLRAHNPGKWNPKTQITVNQDNSSLDELFTRLCNEKKAEGSLLDLPPQ